MSNTPVEVSSDEEATPPSRATRAPAQQDFRYTLAPATQPHSTTRSHENFTGIQESDHTQQIAEVASDERDGKSVLVLGKEKIVERVVETHGKTYSELEEEIQDLKEKLAKKEKEKEEYKRLIEAELVQKLQNDGAGLSEMLADAETQLCRAQWMLQEKERTLRQQSADAQRIIQKKNSQLEKLKEQVVKLQKSDTLRSFFEKRPEDIAGMMQAFQEKVDSLQAPTKAMYRLTLKPRIENTLLIRDLAEEQMKKFDDLSSQITILLTSLQQD